MLSCFISSITNVSRKLGAWRKTALWDIVVAWKCGQHPFCVQLYSDLHGKFPLTLTLKNSYCFDVFSFRTANVAVSTETFIYVLSFCLDLIRRLCATLISLGTWNMPVWDKDAINKNPFYWLFVGGLLRKENSFLSIPSFQFGISAAQALLSSSVDAICSFKCTSNIFACLVQFPLPKHRHAQWGRVEPSFLLCYFLEGWGSPFPLTTNYQLKFK